MRLSKIQILDPRLQTYLSKVQISESRFSSTLLKNPKSEDSPPNSPVENLILELRLRIRLQNSNFRSLTSNLPLRTIALSPLPPLPLLKIEVRGQLRFRKGSDSGSDNPAHHIKNITIVIWDEISMVNPLIGSSNSFCSQEGSFSYT